MLDIDESEPAGRQKVSGAKKSADKKNRAAAAEPMDLSLEDPSELPKARKKKSKKSDAQNDNTKIKRAKLVGELASKKQDIEQTLGSVTNTNQAPQLLPPTVNKNQMLDAFIKGLGVEQDALPNRPPEDLIEDIGRVFAELLGGLQTLMQNRSLLKDRFKLGQTMMKPKSNNPIKFSAGMDDVLPRLLSGKRGAYKASVEAIRECYFDVNADMEAMNEAMRRALSEYLKMFDPVNLQEQFEHVMGKNKFLGGNKKRYWDLYADRYATIVQHAEGRMPEGFANEFVKAFENALSKRKFKKGNGKD